MRITRKITAAFIAARDAQTAYWKALLALEKAIGVEVDGLQDLRDAKIMDLMAVQEDQHVPKTPTSGIG